ncbi:MAG: TVP38/TMEM64 family protein [Bacilli bacterium]
MSKHTPGETRFPHETTLSPGDRSPSHYDNAASHPGMAASPHGVAASPHGMPASPHGMPASPRDRAGPAHGRIWWTLGTVAVGAVAVWLYFRYERYASLFIHRLGPFGVLGAVALMAILCIIPFPAEFLMVIDMQIFGVWKGILYVWAGAMLGSYVTFLLAKRFGETLIRQFVADKHVDRLNELVAKHGALGLLMARLIPFIPFVVLNYACAMIPEVGTWTYLWTTGLGIMPYDAGAALVFLGFSKRTLTWLIAGGVAIVLIWLTALWIRRAHAKQAKADHGDRSEAARRSARLPHSRQRV